MAKIALVGAAGAIGKSIAQALRDRGIEYRAIGRNRERLHAEFANDKLAEITRWNPDEPASVRAALQGIELAFYLVGVPYEQFQLHPIVLKKALDGAIAEGVQKFLLIGTVYPYGRAQSERVTENHPREPHTFKGKMRKEQEDILLKAHSEGRIQGAILRLPDFYGPGVSSSFLHSLFQAAASGGKADLIGPIDRPHEFVYVPDVGPVVLDLASHPEAWGKWWNLAGAGVITQKQIVEEVSRLAGHPIPVRVAGKTALRIFGLFNSFIRELVEMHYLVTDPVILDDTALQNLLGTVHKTPYTEGIRNTYEAARADHP